MDKAKGNELDSGLLFLLFGCGVFFLYRLLTPVILKMLWYWHRHKILVWIGIVLIVLFLLSLAISVLWNWFVDRKEKDAITDPDDRSIYLGVDVETGKGISLKEEFRVAHTQVIGTTDAGKTTSIVEPATVQDIAQGRGLIIVDGKADGKLLNSLYAYAVLYGRQKDFYVLSLARPEISSTYNPFCVGEPEQITERVFATFQMTSDYYKDIQYASLQAMLSLIMDCGEVPMPGVVRELLRDKTLLEKWAKKAKNENLKRDIAAILNDKEETFQEKHSGLVTKLGHFSQGKTAALFNSKAPEINLTEIIKGRKICYFQIPTMQFPFLGEATGKLILQALQSIISEIQVGGKKLERVFSIYLDDFNDYIYPGFASLLNKSRSANIGVVFSHQSLGDLEKIGSDFKQIVSTNTNIKVVMRSNDPMTAEHFAKMFGTKTVEKTTERQSRRFFLSKKTGEQSVRDAEEFIYHPNTFKKSLARGEGIVSIPHPNGVELKRVKFRPIKQLPTLPLPERKLTAPNFLKEADIPEHVQETQATEPSSTKQVLQQNS